MKTKPHPTLPGFVKSGIVHRLAMILLGIAAAGPALAIDVTNTSDGAAPGPAGSLRKAINDAAAGDTINFAVADGGIIVLTAGQLLITKNVTIVGLGARNLTISGNNASGIFEVAKDVTVNLYSLTLSGGFAPSRPPATDEGKFGGAILNSGNLTISGCRITGNRASSSASSGYALGAGIYNNVGATLTMRDSEISSNVCDADKPEGGGLHNDGLASLTNCTVSNNQLLVSGHNFKFGSGAGIYNSGTVNLVNCTINDNYFQPPTDPNGTGVGGGIATFNHATVNIRNTIVAQNRVPPNNVTSDVSSGSGGITSQGHNLVGITNGSTGWITDPNNPNRDYTGTAAQPLVPGLVDPDGTFAPINNGGSTNTVALLPTSPAVDKGDDVVLGAPYNLTTDQRGLGFARQLMAHVDIGAFELDQPQAGPEFVVTTKDEHTDGLCGTHDCTLLEAINASNADANANTISFRPGLAGNIINSSRFGLPIKHPLTIIGPGTLSVTGHGKARIFDVRAGAGSVSISGLALVDGKAVVAGGSTFPVGSGGAIVNAASLTLTDCSLIINSSAEHGGAILNDGTSGGNATLTLRNCTLAGNMSFGSGGAILNHGGASGHATLSLINCTLNQNISRQYGGAIYTDGTNAGNAALTLTNCTFNQNTASIAAGGIYNDAFNQGQAPGVATLLLRNTIFLSGNSAANLVNDSGTITSQGSNLSNDAAGGDAATGPGGFLDQAGDIRNTDPKLGPWQANGGPTNTVALLPGSPAINAGNDSFAPSTDQRGQPRIGVSDIGAFEFNPNPTPSPTPTATPTATPTPAPGSLGNVSTRLQVGTGNNVLFAGFIIQGNASKTLLIRSAGPSLTQFGVPGALGDPQLELHDANNTIGTNDNWQTTQIGGVITSDQAAAIQNSGAPPLSPEEPAMIATLPAGSYSAIVQGVGSTQGVATVEVYDLSQNNGAVLANISTRGFIQTGDNVMIGGFIVAGNPSKILVRATGPSLIPFGINNALADPRLELHDSNGTLAANDDWQTTQVGGIIASDQSAAIQGSGLAPSNAAEAAIIATLAPGNYTAIAQGVNGGTGVGLIEVFALP